MNAPIGDLALSDRLREILDEASRGLQERELEYAVRAWRSARRRVLIDVMALVATAAYVVESWTGPGRSWWLAGMVVYELLDLANDLMLLRRLRVQRDLALVATVQET